MFWGFFFFFALYDGLNWVWQLYFPSRSSDDAEVDEDANYSYTVCAGMSETVQRFRPLVVPNRRNKTRLESRAFLWYLLGVCADPVWVCESNASTLPESVPMRAKWKIITFNNQEWGAEAEGEDNKSRPIKLRTGSGVEVHFFCILLDPLFLEVVTRCCTASRFAHIPLYSGTYAYNHFHYNIFSITI